MTYLIFLSLIIFGIWISYFDIKKGLIKNYSLLILIFVAILINVFFTKAFVDFPLLSFYNILGGILIGVIVWIAGIWSAGDAKLFIALNFLFPITFYYQYPGSFPGIVILVNSAVPLFLFLLFQILVKTSLKQKKESFLLHLKPLSMVRTFLAISAISSLIFIFYFFSRIRLEYLFSLIFVFFIMWFVEQKLKINLTYFFIFILVFSLILSFFFEVPVFTGESLIFIIIFFFLIFFLLVILTLGTPLFAPSVRVDDLREGMILAEMIVQEGRSYVKKPITFLTFLVLLRQRARWQPRYGFNPDGLTKDEIREIQSFGRHRLLNFKDLRISSAIPFAPILFFGSLLTYFARGLFINLFF